MVSWRILCLNQGPDSCTHFDKIKITSHSYSELFCLLAGPIVRDLTKHTKSKIIIIIVF
jgi:hypothetical protein